MPLSAARVVYERCVVRRCVGVQLCGVVCVRGGSSVSIRQRTQSDYEIPPFSFPPITHHHHHHPPTHPHTHTHTSQAPHVAHSFTNDAHRFAWSTICA